jgi:hypothetical protein
MYLDAEWDAGGGNARQSPGSEPDTDCGLVIGHQSKRDRVDLGPGRSRAVHHDREVVHHPARVADLQLGLDLTAGGTRRSSGARVTPTAAALSSSSQ